MMALLQTCLRLVSAPLITKEIIYKIYTRNNIQYTLCFGTKHKLFLEPTDS